MKTGTLLVSAVLATGLPLGAALANGSATTLSGPQGTGFYGFVDPLDLERNTMVVAPSAAAGGTVPPQVSVYDRNRDGIISQSEYAMVNDARLQRGAFSGPSWATNPPVPPE